VGWGDLYGGGPLLPWLYRPFSLLTLVGLLRAARAKLKGHGLSLGLLLLYTLPFYIAFPQARNRQTLEQGMPALAVYFVIAVTNRLGVRESRARDGAKV
jgi:hypothetical protein